MSDLTRIYFRTDANTEIATGHIMRCLAIARACAKQNACITFIVSDEESLTLLQERFDIPGEFGIHCLHSNYQRMHDELPALLSYLDTQADSEYTASNTTIPDMPTAAIKQNSTKPWLFIDSYFATPAYFAALRSHCQIAYLDDLRSFPCEVDLVIHYDTDTDCIHYKNAARKLLGACYTPLREQFEQPAYAVRPSVKNILLSTGGTDPYGVAEHLLQNIFHNTDEAYLPLSDCDYHIVTSKANSRYHALTAMAEANAHIHIHEGVSDMASLMASCDLAVSAGGTTLCELCTVGVPTVSYLMAENQRTAVETFSKKGLIPFAGDIRSKKSSQASSGSSPENLPAVNGPVIASILSFLTQMSVNVEVRKKSSQCMRAFLDGQGAKRIAEALIHP